MAAADAHEALALRVDGTLFMHTFPRCGIHPDEVLRQVREAWARVVGLPAAVCISRDVARQELHEDGTPHVHVGIELHERVRRTISARAFDVVTPLVLDGEHSRYDLSLPPGTAAYDEVPVHHGNLRPAGRGMTWMTLFKYVTKGDKVAHQKKAAGAGFQSGQAYIAYMKESRPMDYLRCHGQVLEIAAEIDLVEARSSIPPLPPLFFPGLFRYPQLQDWVSTVLDPTRGRQERSTCLMLIGPTRTGKSSWARRLLPPSDACYMQCEWDLNLYNIHQKLWILDDMDLSFPQKYAKLILCGKEGSVTDKYRRKVQVHSMPCIWISNSIPEWMRADWAYWTEPGPDGFTNALVVEIDHALYEGPPVPWDVIDLSNEE